MVDAQSEQPIEHAQICIKGDCRTGGFTNEHGEFNLNFNGTSEKEFKLIVNKQGYATQEPWYQVGDNKTIYLVKN